MLKMTRILLVIIFASFARAVFLGCEFNSFDAKNPPVFLQQRFKSHSVLPSSRAVVFAHSATISAYCNPSFNDDEQATNEIVNLECNNGTVSNIYNPYLSCEIEGFYRYPLEECPEGFLSYVSGLKLEDMFVIFQAVCYDDENLQTIFVKYVAKPRPHILSFQKDFNPVDAELLSSTRETLKMPFLPYEVLGNENISEQLSSSVGSIASTLAFTESSLVPPGIFRPFFTHQNKINTLVWWQPLRDGNWDSMQVRLQQLEDDIEIYAGTSGIATAINDNNESVQLWVEKTYGPMAVPLYVWNYVKFKSSTNNDVIFIGVNSPFVKDHLSQEIWSVCQEDVCHMKRYLEDMYKELKYPSLGYVVCCEPNNVNLDIIKGIPQKLLSQHESKNLLNYSPPPSHSRPFDPTSMVINTPRPSRPGRMCYDF